jgi:hypothetical protein
MRKIIMMLGVLMASVLSLSAEVHDYELNVGDFNRLQVLDNVNVVWTCNPDSVGYANFTSEREFVDAFIFTNNGKGTLKVQVTSEALGKANLPTIYLSSAYLNYVENSASFTTRVESPTPSVEFKAVVEGNGTLVVNNVKSTLVKAEIKTGKGSLTINGESTAAKYKMVGTGEIRADELNTTDVECSIMGTGSIYCAPKGLLYVKGLGTTKIYYKGTPTEIKKKGGGKLIQM